MSDETAWWYEDQGETIWPLVCEELKDVLSRRSNARETLVWRDGFPDWQMAGDVRALNSAIANPIPVNLPMSTAVHWRMRWVWLLLCLSVLLDVCRVGQRYNLSSHAISYQLSFYPGVLIGDSPAIILVSVFLAGTYWVIFRAISTRSVVLSLAIGCIANAIIVRPLLMYYFSK
jgi:hypothetical protein